MKLRLCIICFIFSYSLIIPSAKAYNIALNICEYVAADDKKRLRKLLKTNHLKIRDLFSDITCDADNLLVFAAKRNANDVGDFIIKKVPKSVLETELSSIEPISTNLAELIKTRIQ